MPPDLTTHLGNLRLANPVLSASGTFGYAREFESLIDLNRLGGIIVKGLSLKPNAGNPPPRIVETPCGMLNAIGLENVGIDAFERDKLPFLKKLRPPILANIYGKQVYEYERLAARVEEMDGIAGVEVNISCPNVKAGGVAFGVAPGSAYAVVDAVRRRTTKHLMVKLTPNVADITPIAKAAADAGADSLSLINTLTGMVVDVDARRPVLANITGGLSGPAIRPVAVRMVWQVARAVDLPVVGIGGIMTAIDALQFIIVGASAVQIGTANFINPRTTVEIIDGIESYMSAHGIPRFSDLVGSLNLDEIVNSSICRDDKNRGYPKRKDRDMEFQSLKEVVEFAKEKETEAADFYTRLSEKEDMSGAREMLLEFAQQERKHRSMLENLEKGGVEKSIESYEFKWIVDLKRSDYMVEMEEREDLAFREILIIAMKREEKALALYNVLLDNARGENEKKVFKLLCQEEAKHKLGLETLYDDYMAQMGD